MTQATNGFSDADRALLRDTLRQLLTRSWPAASALALSANTDCVIGLWRQLAEQGTTALCAGSDSGGWREALIAIEELGRAACPVPLLEAALCQQLVSQARGTAPVAAQLLADLVPAQFLAEGVSSGKLLPAVAFGALGGDTDAGGAMLVDDQRLNGAFRYVEGLGCATHMVLALSCDDDCDRVALVEADAVGITIISQPGLAVPALSELRLASTPCVPMSLPSGSIAELAALARLGLVARSLGAARRAFDLVLQHTKARRQFGHLIGQFQAVQHKLANGLITLDATTLLVANAAQRVDSGDSDWQFAAHATFAFATPALRQLELDVQHTFGAIGYAEEHEAPRHFRRVYTDLARLGGARGARAALAAKVLTCSGTKLPDMDLGTHVNELRSEIRTWLATHWNEAARHRERQRPFQQRGVDAQFSRLLASQGWVAAAWPTEYGGRGFGPLEQYVLMEELSLARAPTGAHNVSVEIIGPALIRYGTPEQKAHFLPAFRRGELLFSLGYSESEAGSDLASLRTRAVPDGDSWIIDGEKLWTTRGDVAHYHWLAARTDPAATPRHAGISIFMVPLNSPGISIRTSMAMYGHTFSSVHYDHVRVPDAARVGAINGGWQVITHALASERVVMGAYVAAIRSLFDDLVRHAATMVHNRQALRDDPLLRDRLGGLAAEIEAARQLSINAVRIAAHGGTPVHEAAMSKVYSGELLQRLTLTAIDLLGPAATLGEDSRDAILDGRIEQQLRQSIMMVVGGGSAEVQRNLIAVRALGLPR
jgi:alkylation response protein AidB-like acyl-CoA dehydrogenase